MSQLELWSATQTTMLKNMFCNVTVCDDMYVIKGITGKCKLSTVVAVKPALHF